MINNQTCPLGSMTYIVKSGDTFYTISRSFGISLDDLIAANPRVDHSKLYIGEVICIPKTTPAPPMSKCPILSVGSKGASVSELQHLLLNNGFNSGPIDGIFGSMTHTAVIGFQRSRNLVQDGVVGIMTWTALGVNCHHQPSTCPAGTTAYTIKAGDSLYLLAQRFNTTVDAIRRANPTVDPDHLQIGQVICIP